MKLNYDKLQNKQDEVEFFSEAYTTSGCNQSKVSTITVMPLPTNRKQVKSLIGLVNYLYKFSLRFSELADLIRDLS